MTRTELIKLTGDLITELDVVRSCVPRGTDDRRRLDDGRDDLDTQQRQLVRRVFQDNTKQFQDLTREVNEVAATLRQTINDVNKIAETLGRLVDLVAVVQKIIDLIP